MSHPTQSHQNKCYTVMPANQTGDFRLPGSLVRNTDFLPDQFQNCGLREPHLILSALNHQALGTTPSQLSLDRESLKTFFERSISRQRWSIRLSDGISRLLDTTSEGGPEKSIHLRTSKWSIQSLMPAWNRASEVWRLSDRASDNFQATFQDFLAHLKAVLEKICISELSDRACKASRL